MIVQKQEAWACFTDDMKYRYWLKRIWDPEKPMVLFIMLNPSTADAEHDDPTIKRCIGFAKAWGYGSIWVVNLFAFRATNPKYLWKEKDPKGKHNYCTIEGAVGKCDLVIAAWGAIDTHYDHIKEVCKIVTCKKDLHCISLTKDGKPAHPLYLARDLKPTVYKPKGVS